MKSTTLRIIFAAVLMSQIAGSSAFAGEKYPGQWAYLEKLNRMRVEKLPTEANLQAATLASSCDASNLAGKIQDTMSLLTQINMYRPVLKSMGFEEGLKYLISDSSGASFKETPGCRTAYYRLFDVLDVRDHKNNDATSKAEVTAANEIKNIGAPFSGTAESVRAPAGQTVASKQINPANKDEVAK